MRRPDGEKRKISVHTYLSQGIRETVMVTACSHIARVLTIWTAGRLDPGHSNTQMRVRGIQQKYHSSLQKDHRSRASLHGARNSHSPPAREKQKMTLNRRLCGGLKEVSYRPAQCNHAY